MKRFRRFLPLILAASVIITGSSGCFIFKRKNHCGDCPTFKGSAKKH